MVELLIIINYFNNHNNNNTQKQKVYSNSTGYTFTPVCDLLLPLA